MKLCLIAVLSLAALAEPAFAKCAPEDTIQRGTSIYDHDVAGHPWVEITMNGNIWLERHSQRVKLHDACNPREARRFRLESNALLAEDSFTPDTIPAWLQN